MRTATKFTTSIVQARESFGGDLLDGRPFVIHFGDRRQVDDEVVRRWPVFWMDDGVQLIPFDRSEIAPEPSYGDDEGPKVRDPKPIPVLRSRKDFREEFTIKNAWGVPEKFVIKLHKGNEVRGDEWWLEHLSERQKRGLFEEVEA